MGDMNAKVGSDNAEREHVMGAEGMGTINENGEFFVDFCEMNDLVIGWGSLPTPADPTRCSSMQRS